MLEALILSEKEVVEHTIDLGFDGKELSSQAWRKRGYLLKDGTYKKLIKKLESHYEQVSVTGKTSLKVYTLIGAKNIPDAVVDGRKGRNMPRSSENEALTDYVHSKLKQMDLTKIYTWSNLRGEMNFVFNHKKNLRAVVAKVFGDFLSEDKLKSVWSYTEWYLSQRAKEDIKLALGHLELQGKIKVVPKYMATLSEPKQSKSNVEIGFDMYKEIEETIMSVARKHEIDYIDYKRSFVLLFQPEEMANFKGIVEAVLTEKYQYKAIYEAMEVIVLNETVENAVDGIEARELFLQKCFKLVCKKTRKEKFLLAQNKGQRFHYLCMLLLLQESNIEVDREVLQKEISYISDDLGAIIQSFEETKPLGFGLVK